MSSLLLRRFQGDRLKSGVRRPVYQAKGECLKCGFRFSTYEEVEILDLMVVKRDGRKESYSREKIVKGLKRALEKRPVTDDNFKKLINLIERDLQILRKNEVTSAQVGQIAMKNLKRFDQVAYIRFASVYESFKDAHEFRRELNKLLKTRRQESKSAQGGSASGQKAKKQ